MRCSKCGYINKSTAKYCSGCGHQTTALSVQQFPPQVVPPPLSSGQIVPISPGQIQPLPPQAAGLRAYDQPQGFPNHWKGKQPLVEGKVLQADAPRQEKNIPVSKIALVLGLALLKPVLAFLPLIGGAQVSVQTLRVEDNRTGNQRSVKVVSEQSSDISLGDWIAVWGEDDKGTIVMNRTYNYTTDAWMKIKKSFLL